MSMPKEELELTDKFYGIPATKLELALAQRFHDVWIERWKLANPAAWEVISPHRQANEVLRAREALRQMEWARMEYSNTCWGYEKLSRLSDPPPLTLAPPEWEP